MPSQKRTLKYLLPGFISLTALTGCQLPIAQSPPTAYLQPGQVESQDAPAQKQVRIAAKTMYRMVLNGSAKELCKLVSPRSVASLAQQFPDSRFTPNQICVLISSAAIIRFKKTPGGKEALQESLESVDEYPVAIQGNTALMGDHEHHTRFQKIRGRWRPLLPPLLATDANPEFYPQLSQV